MTINYKWEIVALETAKEQNGLQDVVTKIHYRLTANEGDLSAEIEGFEESETPDNSNFTAFSQLTEEMVIQWLEDKLVTVHKYPDPGSSTGEMFVDVSDRLQEMKNILEKNILEQSDTNKQTLVPPWK